MTVLDATRTFDMEVDKIGRNHIACNEEEMSKISFIWRIILKTF